MAQEFLQLMEDWKGYNPVRSSRISEAALVQMLDLVHNTSRMPAHKWEYLMKESVTTADFPVLFGGIIDRLMLARYKAAVSPWRSYVKTGTLRDFRTTTFEKVQGQDSFLPLVQEKAEYPITPSANARYEARVSKRGRSFDISWEALINDFLDAFGDIPERFAEAALITEAWIATTCYAAVGGPHPGLFGAPIADTDGQNVTNQGVLPLTIANLETTLQLMAMQTDVQGRPLGIRGQHLVVPPALEFTARAILSSATKAWIDPAGAANAVASGFIPVPDVNVIPQLGLQLHVDPYLPIVDTASPNTTWYLFAGWEQGTWGKLNFLRGHETPEICIRASDKMAIGGGLLDPLSGDFDSDNIRYRVRHVLGCFQADPRYAYSQVGP